MAYRVQYRIGVAAPAFAVWDVISDLEAWGEWNPLYPEVEGRLSIGALLSLRRTAGGKSERQEVRVVDWVPNAQIVWKRDIAPFAHSLSYLEIEPLSDRGCILAAGEIFEGYLGEIVGKQSRRALMAGFAGLCEAAKARAEATWDGTPGEAPPPPPPPPPPKARLQTIQMSLRGPRKR